MTGTDLQSLLMFIAIVAVPAGLLIFIIKRRQARTVDARLRKAVPYLLHDLLLPGLGD